MNHDETPASSPQPGVAWRSLLRRRSGGDAATISPAQQGRSANGVMGPEEVRRVGERAQLQAGQESVQNTTAMVSFFHGLFGSNPFTVPLAALLQLVPTFVAHAGSEFTSNRKQIRRQVAWKSLNSLFHNTGPTLGTYAVTGGSLPAAAAASLVTMGYLGVKAAKAEAADEDRFATRREKCTEALQQVAFGSSSVVLGGAAGHTLNQLINSRFFDKANEVVNDYSVGNPVTLAVAGTVGAGYTGYRVLKSRAAKRRERAGAATPPTVTTNQIPRPPGAHRRKRDWRSPLSKLRRRSS